MRNIFQHGIQFLYDESQHLIAIGYNVEDHRRDGSFYDLLASEARLFLCCHCTRQSSAGELVCIGETTYKRRRHAGVAFRSGSMFEYLMPDLVMPSYDNTLLDQTGKGVVKGKLITAGSSTCHGGFQNPVIM